VLILTERKQGDEKMGACIEMKCPKCKEVFIVSPSMMGLGVDFHCPFCDHYFKEEQAVSIKR
jgi:uncharacterized C2H2 Zn-finger protein